MKPLWTWVVSVSIVGFGFAAIGCAGPGTSGVASGEAAATATAADVPMVAPSPSFAGQVIDIVAKNREFSLTKMEVVAGSAFQIRFDNQDEFKHTIYIAEGVPEDVTFALRSEAAFDAYAEASLFKGEWFSGPATVIYDVAALPRGSYVFFCVPHPAMIGTIEVK